MKQSIKKPLALMCLAALVGCGKSADKKKETPSNTPSNPLEGVWATECKASPAILQALAAGQIKSTSKKIEIKGNTMIHSKLYYLDETCAVAIGVMAQEATYAEGEALPNGQNAKALDIDIQKTNFLVTTDEAAKAFNDLKICGLEGWAPNQPMDITGKECIFGKVSPAATTHYTAFKLENNAIYLSDFDCSEGETGCRTYTTAEDATVGRESELKVVYKKQ